MISAYLLTIPGLERLAQEELTDIIAVPSQVKGPGVLFKASARDVASVAYRSQLAVRVVAHPSFFSAGSSLDDIRASFAKHVNTDVLKESLEGQKSFRVECSRFGEHAYRSMDAAAAIGTDFDAGMPAVVTGAQAMLYLHIEGKDAVIGLDLCGFDVAKRYYKVFPSPSSIKGPLAAALERMAGSGVFLDALCGSGELIIERALRQGGRSVRHYQQDVLAFARLAQFKDEARKVFETSEKESEPLYAYDPHMPHVVAAKKNAKIAGVQKLIRFGRSDLDWIDTKFTEHEIGAAASNMARCRPQQIDAYFYQFAYVAKKKAHVVVAGPNVTAVAAKYGFALESESIVGRQSPVTVRKFVRMENL